MRGSTPSMRLRMFCSCDNFEFNIIMRLSKTYENMSTDYLHPLAIYRRLFISDFYKNQHVNNLEVAG